MSQAPGACAAVCFAAGGGQNDWRQEAWWQEGPQEECAGGSYEKEGGCGFGDTAGGAATSVRQSRITAACVSNVRLVLASYEEVSIGLRAAGDDATGASACVSGGLLAGATPPILRIGVDANAIRRRGRRYHRPNPGLDSWPIDVHLWEFSTFRLSRLHVGPINPRLSGWRLRYSHVGARPAGPPCRALIALRYLFEEVDFNRLPSALFRAPFALLAHNRFQVRACSQGR
jgi:hypothetical protein